MRDTPAAFQRMVRERMSSLSAEQRFLLGAEMFDTARAFALASLPPGLDEGETRVRLCSRLYGPEFARRCEQALRGRAA